MSVSQLHVLEVSGEGRHLRAQPGDLELAPPYGLPFPTGSLPAVRVDAPLDRLADAEVAAFLRSAHRVLAHGGSAAILARASALPRLERQAVLAGFLDRRRTVEGDGSVLQLRKGLDACSIPLVTIAVPTFKVAFFADALASACDQTSPTLEIVLSDNCPDEGVATLVERFLLASTVPIRYQRHGELRYRNTQNCFAQARGRYVKFLLDDDLLDPDCVRRMVLAFEAFSDEVSLVTSRRRRIDELGNPLPDDASSAPLVAADARLDGVELGNRILTEGVNVVGELSTTMFRKDDLVAERPFFFSWQGREYPGLGDLSCWLNLLSRGDAYYFADPLSAFRIHAAQNTHRGDEDTRLSSILEWADLVRDGRRAGFLSDDSDYGRALETIHRLIASRRNPSTLTTRGLDTLDRTLRALDEERARYRRNGSVTALRRLLGSRSRR